MFLFISLFKRHKRNYGSEVITYKLVKIVTGPGTGNLKSWAVGCFEYWEDPERLFCFKYVYIYTFILQKRVSIKTYL